MQWTTQSQQTSFYLQMMEKRIPKDDVFRIIDSKIDFSFINELTKPYYSDLGPTGYCPERLFRMLIVMYMANISSERQLVEELNLNLKYMWFTRTDLDNPVPDHSTFSVLRSRLGDDLFKQIFNNVLMQMLDMNIIKPKSISVDSTSVLADVKVPSKKDKNAKIEGKQVISSNDPDARYGHTSPKKGFFGYKTQIMADNNSGAILNVDAQPGSFDDKTLNADFIKEPIKEHNLKIKEAALDKGFDSYKVRNCFRKEKIRAAIPLKKEKSKLFVLEDFTIDLKNKQATCPANYSMKYLSFDTKRKTYEFIGTACQSCQIKSKCTTSDIARRISVFQDYLLKQHAKKFNKTPMYEKISRKRGCVERINNEIKRFHGLVRSKFRRLWKFKIQCYLSAIVINLKRVAKFFLQQQKIRLSGP